MSCAEIMANAIEPAFKLLPSKMDTPEARVMMLAIGLQESKLIHRCQIVNGGGRGPARGLWQFEEGGGVRGVCQHPASRALMRKVCDALDVEFEIHTIWEQFEHNDILAASAARLLLWTDARPLPPLGMDLAAWHYYIRNWRPGKPHPETWADHYLTAWRFIQ